MCGPLTAKVSLRCIASKIEARVFSSAHTPVRPAVPNAAWVHAGVDRAGHAQLDRPVGRAMRAEEVVLTVGNDGVVRVRRGTEAELVRIEALGVLQREAILQRLPGVAADDVRNAARRIAQQERHDLEARELVVGRKQRMRFRRALELLDLDQRLVAHARLGIGGIDRAALGVDLGRVHAAVRQVGVVRDGQQVVAGLPLAVHPVPEVHRMGRVQGAERHRRHLGAVLEEDVAVEVHVARHRRPFVGAEGRELPGLVRLVGERDVLLPDGAGDLRGHQRLDRRTAHQNPDAVLEDALHFLRCGLVRH